MNPETLDLILELTIVTVLVAGLAWVLFDSRWETKRDDEEGRDEHDPR